MSGFVCERCLKEVWVSFRCEECGRGVCRKCILSYTGKKPLCLDCTSVREDYTGSKLRREDA